MGYFKHYYKIFAAGLTMSIVVLSGCDNDDDMPSHNAKAMYSVEVSNLSNGQPLTPVAAILHTNDYAPWVVGESASNGLEVLAESGDASQFINEADMDQGVVASISSSAGVIMPGTSQTVMLETRQRSQMQLSVASMLANSNDAFTGVSNWDISDLDVGDSKTILSHVFDAGTEANSEIAAAIPGPAGMGEGFNQVRDDNNFITIHAGVITSDDGLLNSALNESHRWNGVAAKIMVSRIQ